MILLQAYDSLIIGGTIEIIKDRSLLNRLKKHYTFKGSRDNKHFDKRIGTIALTSTELERIVYLQNLRQGTHSPGCRSKYVFRSANLNIPPQEGVYQTPARSQDTD